MTTMIVVADAARARIFTEDNGAMKEHEALVHPESREHTGDLRTGGKGASGKGPHRHQTGNEDATSDKHEAFFASDVAEYLKQAHDQGKIEKLIIAAAPSFLGTLRQKMDKSLQQCIDQTVDKELSRESAEEIRDRFAPNAKLG
ncbi:host attachment protein [Larsenimonas rhizosphaerae]|uniref:host attachment protein n=1 Tax=Larsenimonas rhizosphaerae TaxID=2944682 RepID=UPI002034A2F5|nr:host attachment protein [Larsenimonas rhizosphaerae]MCM2131690.1 host attachment protein [Larsenimonas rhizosphaerae]